MGNFIVHFSDINTGEKKTTLISALTMQDAVVIFNREYNGVLLYVERNYS